MDEPNKQARWLPGWLWVVVLACVAIDVFIIGKCAASLVAILLLILNSDK